MSHEELKSLKNLDDVLIVQKIEKRDPFTVMSNNDSIKATQCLCFESGCDCERNLLVEEQEAIRKKQLQMLQADERGKQALLAEIAALKERQEHRAELIRNRQRALNIEKERARKIASLPPPLPKSIKALLTKNDDETKLNKPDVQRPDLLAAITVKQIEACDRNTENKENIIDPKELEMKQKMHEEWDMKAKKRYNEALKKDRLKDEYSKIMKQLQNAELLKRQEMAKNISSDKIGMPCLLSDKMQTAKKQVDMEDVAEKIFKKSGAKEHVIEDIEGYQDHYEEKYKHIDSNYEAKMIDCIPSFVKENYDYLFEEESKFFGGQNFSGLDDSNSDILNQAYIETPPGADELNSKDIHNMISNLDRMRSDLECEYEQNVKPLLVAAVGSPKKDFRDQAVETEPVKVPAEDKAVETDELIKNVPTSPSLPDPVNFKNAGVMAYKRSKPQAPILSAYEKIPIHMHNRDVQYVMPVDPDSKDPTESWSPSSYCSLPSKHGIPIFSNKTNSTVCDICVAEKKKDPIKNHFVQEFLPKPAEFNQEKSENLTVSSGKTSLSEYVQQLVKKHLVPESTKNSLQRENSDKSFSDSCLPAYSGSSKTISPAFEREIIGKSKVGIFNEPDNVKELISPPVKNTSPDEVKKPHVSAFVTEQPISETETILRSSGAKREIVKNNNTFDDIYLKLKDNDIHKSSNEYSEYDYEAKRIQAIQQVLSHNLPRFTLEENDKPEEENSSRDAKNLIPPVQNEINFGPHIYHELSTIQEVDSILTADSLQLSHSKLSNASGPRGEKGVLPKEKLQDSAEGLKMVSLLDLPDASIADLAKSIHFVPETEQKVEHGLETSRTVFTISSTESSKEHLSTPTLASNSHSSISTPSLPLSSSVQSAHSAESRENKDIQNCILSGFISDLEVQDENKSDAFHSKQSKKDLPMIISGYISDLDMPQVSTTNISNSDRRKREINSIISGYISDLEMPNMYTSDADNLEQDRKDTVHSKLSGYVSNLDVEQITNSNISDLVNRNTDINKAVSSDCISNLELPEIIKTSLSHFYQRNEDNRHFIDSNFIRNVNTPHENESLKFLAMTPYSDISNSSFYYHPMHSALKLGDLRKITVNKNLLLKQEQLLTPTSSEGSFKSMTPHSNTLSSSESSSTASKNDFQYKSSSIRSFKPMTPHSYVSSPSESCDTVAKKDFQYNSSSIRSFKPMTPHSNISSPSESSDNSSRKDLQHEGINVGSFKGMTPHPSVTSLVESTLKRDTKEEDDVENSKPVPLRSNLSSPNELVNYILKKDTQNSDKAGSLKALTPHSNVSSPTDVIISLGTDHRDYTSSLKSFKDLTPHSYISSPVSDLSVPFENVPIGDASTSKRSIDKITSENTIKPVIFTFDILTDSLVNKNMSSKTKHVSRFNCNLTLKRHLGKPANHQMTTRPIDSRKYGSRSKNRSQMKHKGLYLTSPKQLALACSSDFFVPSMNEDSTSSYENSNKELINVSTGNNADLIKPESAFDSPVIVLDDKKKNLEKLFEKNNLVSEAISLNKAISNEVVDEKKSKETPNTQISENGRNVQKQCSNLASLSSASSSTESVSGISHSKVVCQSTPIKNISEIMQEPGILEEPNLTLINTQLSCRMDTTEIPKGPLTSITSKEFTHQEKNSFAIPSTNTCVTPVSVSPQFSSSVDTPSMLSFLQHELSCKQEQNNSVQSSADNISNPSTSQENNTPVLSEVKRSLFKRSCYKERTKRLWNNLEEVKKKNLADERKKEMEINRKKAREFSMKLTPKLKRK